MTRGGELLDFASALAANRRLELDPLVLVRELNQPGDDHHARTRLLTMALLAEGQLLRFDPLARLTASGLNSMDDAARSRSAHQQRAVLILKRVLAVGNLFQHGPQSSVRHEFDQLSQQFAQIGEVDEQRFTTGLYQVVAGSLTVDTDERCRLVEAATSVLAEIEDPTLSDWTHVLAGWSLLAIGRPDRSRPHLDHLRRNRSPLLERPPLQALAPSWDQLLTTTDYRHLQPLANTTNLPVLLRLGIAPLLLESGNGIGTLELLSGHQDLRLRPFAFLQRQLLTLRVAACAQCGRPPDRDEVCALIQHTQDDDAFRRWIYNFVHTHRHNSLGARELTIINRFFAPDHSRVDPLRQSADESPWMLKLLGDPPQITNGREHHLLPPVAATILIALALRSGRLNLEELLCICWPDESATVAANRFKVHLHKLRSISGGLLRNALERHGDELRLTLPARWRVDIWELEDLCDTTVDLRLADRYKPDPRHLRPELARHPVLGPPLRELLVKVGTHASE